MQTHDAATSAAWGAIMNTTPPTNDDTAPVHDAQVATRADRVLERISRALGLCEHGTLIMWPDGREMTRSARFADWFWPSNDCGCCWWYRGFAAGIGIGAAVAAITIAAITAII